MIKVVSAVARSAIWDTSYCAEPRAWLASRAFHKSL
jgi:hypothetical protein